METASLLDNLAKEIKDITAILKILKSQFGCISGSNINSDKNIDRFVFVKLNIYDCYSCENAFMKWTEHDYPNGKEQIDWNKIKFIRLAPSKNISDEGFRKSIRRMKRAGLIKKEVVNDCVSLNRPLLGKLEILFADEYFDAITKNEETPDKIKKTQPRKLTPEEIQRKEKAKAIRERVKAAIAKSETK